MENKLAQNMALDWPHPDSGLANQKPGGGEGDKFPFSSAFGEKNPPGISTYEQLRYHERQMELHQRKVRDIQEKIRA